MSLLGDEKSIFLFGLTVGISAAALVNLLSSLYGPQQSRQRKSLVPTGALAKIHDEFQVSADRLHRIAKQMQSEMRRGLAADGQTLKMIPSHVTRMPSGTESGSFLALDLGGSNFRVCQVQLLGGASPSAGQQQVRVRQRKFVVSEELKKGDGEKLFDFFAECVKMFLEEIEQNSKALKLGFTFSFPVQQIAVDKGSLMQWTKGFVAAGVEGQDVVQLLQNSLSKKSLNVKVAALVNDTVGTLIAHAYTDPQTFVAVILGTGTNAAYLEKMDQLAKWKGKHVYSNQMIINTEWGAFDEEGAVLPITQYDRLLDKESEHPGQQTFEKMISGMYLGEIVRLILLDLVFTGYLFNGQYPPSQELMQKHRFETAFMSRIERDHSIELSDTKMVLEDILQVAQTSIEDRRIVKRVCEVVGTRAARLAAAGVAAIVTKINRLDGCTVAIDGSLFEHYPHFGNRMRDALRDILGITAENIVLAQARDGSGQGAAIIAALVSASSTSS